MTDLDKFYSDADRVCARAASGTLMGAEKTAEELVRLFLLWTRDYGVLATSLAQYWKQTYASTLTTDQARKKAVDWLGALISLFIGEFSPEMNFPDSDWNEIRDTINAEADDLDLDMMMRMLSIIVERGKA